MQRRAWQASLEPTCKQSSNPPFWVTVASPGRVEAWISTNSLQIWAIGKVEQQPRFHHWTRSHGSMNWAIGARNRWSAGRKQRQIHQFRDGEFCAYEDELGTARGESFKPRKKVGTHLHLHDDSADFLSCRLFRLFLTCPSYPCSSSRSEFLLLFSYLGPQIRCSPATTLQDFWQN